LNGGWSAKDFQWLSVSDQNDELFKVVARQQLNKIAKQLEDEKRKYNSTTSLESEIEEISLKYQVMS